ncbi:adrenocortical dysplasia protein homolog isoform X2 [Choloepus didactylus]|uniref:adrenocortical dysplasia protein homolog isoform X2 n=1 Tax=Choloepus didactylus TaxID=27675 RepID=UPI00189C6FD2|nr:adrenocortical dysplasia protein homolog isoform X2 [Choloepus didactylus]
MAGSGSLVLRPWIRELVLGSEARAGPQAGQLLEVLQEVEASGASRAPDASDLGAALLVSDGTHSVRCLVTQEALNASDWEEKEFGFRGAEGRLLLLQDCGVRIQVPEGSAPAEFYLQVDRFSLLPTEQPRVRVAGCNQDPDVQKKLYDCLEEHLSESASPSEGLSLSQLLDEVQEDKEHRGALVRLAESCLMLTGPCTAAPVTRWAASRCRATGEAMYTIPSLWLHISENDQQILSSLGPAPELSLSDPALQNLSLTLVSSPSLSPSSSGTPAFSGHMQSEESGSSISLLPALSLSAPDPLQGSSQSLPAICSAPRPPSPSSPHPSQAPSSPLLSHTPSLLSLGHVPSPHQAHVIKAHKPHLEFKELGLPPKNQQPPPRSRTTMGALEPSPIWEPPKRHRDGSAFQYEYEPPCTSLCTQVQAVRLPPQLVAWALHILLEPQPESELTQV